MHTTSSFQAYIRSIALKRDRVSSFDEYPFNIPALRNLDELGLDPAITFIVGENGTGKSTLLEAIALAAGFNPEGGSRNYRFASHDSHACLHKYIRLVRGIRRPKDGFFLRAETLYTASTYLTHLMEEFPQYIPPGMSFPHARSHGEAFFDLLQLRFGGKGLYILDEPEAALSPTRQLSLLSRMRELIQQDSQFIIATHSPIIMAYPGALIYVLSSEGISSMPYEQTEHYRISHDFFLHREGMLRELMQGSGELFEPEE